MNPIAIFNALDWTQALLYSIAILSTLSYLAALLLKLDKKSLFREYAQAFTVAVWLALGIRSTLAELYSIPSESMVPTLLIGDHLLVNKAIYGHHIPFTKGRVFNWRKPKRGEIVIFVPPASENRFQTFVKRCVGLPGDILEVRDKVIYINGNASDYPQSIRTGPTYASNVDMGMTVFRPQGQILRHSNRDWYGPITIPAACYWMMGDNRDNSKESRFFGPIPEEDLRGRPLFRYYPFDRLGFVQ
jgi:signal peptidase I